MCRVIGQPRSTQRYRRVEADDEAALTEAIVRLASAYGRYGYRRITALLRGEGWYVNHKRVERSTYMSTATGGAKGACEATQARPVVAQRRILHPSTAELAQTTSGPMTSSWLGHTMAGRSAC